MKFEKQHTIFILKTLRKIILMIFWLKFYVIPFHNWLTNCQTNFKSFYKKIQSKKNLLQFVNWLMINNLLIIVLIGNNIIY